jgi:hypothetical protein
MDVRDLAVEKIPHEKRAGQADATELFGSAYTA